MWVEQIANIGSHVESGRLNGYSLEKYIKELMQTNYFLQAPTNYCFLYWNKFSKLFSKKGIFIKLIKIFIINRK